MSPSGIPLAGHRGQHGGEGADRVVAARRRRGAAGELGDGGPVLLGHHDPGGQVIPVEQLVLAAQQVVLAVAPRRFGVGAVAGAARRGPGEGLQVRPVHGQRPAGILELVRDRCLQQVVADAPAAGRRAARPVRPCRGRPRPGRRCARSAGRSAGAGRASSPRSRRAAAGRPRAVLVSAWWTRVRWAGLPSAWVRHMPASRVRTVSCRARTPMGRMASIRGATPEASMISSNAASGIIAVTPRAAGPRPPRRPAPGRRPGRRAAGSR